MYYDKLSDLGIKLTRRYGSEKCRCPQCSDARKNKTDKPLSVNITTGEYNCFSGDTRVITSVGTKAIKDILYQPIFVIDGNGEWCYTTFKKYGTEELYELTVSRNGQQKKIFTTANHRWFIRENIGEVITKNLLLNQRLRCVYSKKSHYYGLLETGIQHGFVFGDGCLENKRRNSRAYFCGKKDAEMIKYFPHENPKHAYEDKIIISYLPKEYKSLPALDEPNEYLFSWLAGYFAADGDIGENGMPSINSAKRENLEFIRNACNRVGIGTFGINEYERDGFGRTSKIYRLSFLTSTLQENFFLLSKHKERFLSLSKLFERKRWVVKSVKKTERVEDVYCCEVLTTGSFVLEDNILTGNCHHCGWKGNVRSFIAKREHREYSKPPADVLKSIELKESIVAWFNERGISKTTLDKFMIYAKKEWMPQTQKEENCICFPYFKDGEMVNVKYRDVVKNFKLHKDAELVFYNLQSVGDKKHCIIVEGEIDCMAVYESGFGVDKIISEEGELMNDDFSKWAVVSVPNGASKGNQKLEYLDNCAEWFIGLHEIVIATDGDEAGIALQQELIRRLGIERCKTISYPIEECVPKKGGGKRRCKDLNEVLQYLGKEVVINTINNSEQIPVEGVYEIDDIFPSMLQNFKNGVPLAPTTRFPETDTYWRWKKGDINLFTGYANWGKTFYILQMMLTKSIWDGWKWGVFCPENYPANDFYDDLIEMHAGKWLNEMKEEEYVEAAQFIGKHIFYVYPEDSHDIHSIHEKFRYLVLKKGIDGVLVDPFNQLDHNQKAYQREDQYLSEVLKDIKRFALLNAVVYNIVAHPKNPHYQEGKVLPVVDMYDIHGGSMWGNKVDLIVSYHRPRFHEDKNSTEVEIYVQKLKRKRTGGKLGNFPLRLVWGKKRYEEDGGYMPCDPKAAMKQRTYGSQQDIRLPYKDNDEEIEEAPF